MIACLDMIHISWFFSYYFLSLSFLYILSLQPDLKLLGARLVLLNYSHLVQNGLGIQWALVNVCWQNYVYSCTHILIVVNSGGGGMDGFPRRAMRWLLPCTMKDQRSISDLSPEPCTVYPSHQSLLPWQKPQLWPKSLGWEILEFHQFYSDFPVSLYVKIPNNYGTHSPMFGPMLCLQCLGLGLAASICKPLALENV